MQTPDQGSPKPSQQRIEGKPASPPTRIEPKPLDACVICLEPVSERAVVVPCNHCAFDFICIVTWIQANSTCPLCKTKLTAIQYDWRSPNDYKEYRVAAERAPEQASLPLIRRPRSARPRPSHYRPYRPSPSTEENATQLNLDLAVFRRRYVYRHKLYSLHVGSNRVSCFKDFTPSTFTHSPELQSRARKWIRRELQVFDFLTPSPASTSVPASSASQLSRRNRETSRQSNNAEFLLEYVVAILRTVDIKDSSGRGQAMLAEFLGEDNAQLFLHELAAWLRSPYTGLEDWDRHVQYRVKLPGFSGVPEALASDATGCEVQSTGQPDFERFRQRGMQARRRYEAD